MLQRILAGHPAIFSLPEPWIMLQPAYMLKNEGIHAEYNISLAKNGVSDFLSSLEAGEDLLIDGLRAQAGILYKKALAVGEKKFFLDKTPRYYNIIPELYRIFPHAQFIFLLRNPVAVLASALTTWFEGDTAKFMASENYRQDMLQGPAKFLRGIHNLGKKAVIVRYEELVAKPQNTLKKLFSSLDLPYITGIKNYAKHSFKQGRLGDQTGVVKYEKPMACHVEKWKSTLKKSASINMALGYLEQLGPEFLNDLGYSYNGLYQALIEKSKQAQPKESPLAHPAVQRERAHQC